MHYQSSLWREPTTQRQKEKDNVLEVYGEASVFAAPDLVNIRLGVITDATDLSTALNENSSAMQRILDALQRLGIPKENIRTDEYRIDIQYDYTEGKQIFRGYRITNILKVAVEDVTKAGVVVDTAVKNGANTVSNIEFSVADQDEYYNKALTTAVNNAKEKATTIASAAGVTIHEEPFFLAEVVTRQQPPIPYETTAMVKGVSAPPIEAGKMEITAKVQVKYSFS